METQAVVATRSLPLLPQSLAQRQQLQDGARSVSILSSLGRQWSFRVERRKLTLLSSRRRYLVDVRAKKSGAGSSKVKSREPEAEEDDTEPATGTKKLFKLPGTQKLPSKGGNRAKDNNTVFVAGATGKVGRRTVKELVRLGYKVRAGVRNPDNAQFLLELEEEMEESDNEEGEEQPKKGLFANFSVEKLFGFLGPKSKRGAGTVELVECDLEKSVDSIEEALGNAGVVICTIGASEKEVLDVTGPYRIDYKATKNLIDAASTANVNHFILVTSLGTQKFGWPAAVLNLFWGVLYWKAKAEEALVESGIPFTIVRPGGMERPTDAYKETHNLRLAEADTLFGGQVSNLQVAELMAAVVGNLDLARNKVLEAVAETTVPLRPFEDLLAEISSIDEETKPDEKNERSDISKGTRQQPKQQQEEDRAAALLKRQAAEKEKIEARQAAEKEKTEALRQKLQQEYDAARLKEEEARQEAQAAEAQKAEVERRTAEMRSKLQAAEQAAREAKALETALITAARQGKKLSDREKEEIIASVRSEIEAEKKTAEAKQKAVKSPTEKPKMEAKPKAPVKSKAEVVNEKQAQQEAEKKAKQEAEAKAAAAELVAKAEAEAKAKADAAEAEKKRMEAEQKAKAEEEKNKIEAELKAKADAAEAEKKRIEAEEEKKKIEVKLKAKQEEEEKKRTEAQRKAKEEEEKEKKKIEAESKTQEEDEEKAAATIEAGAKPKGFRWPWQKEEESVPTGSSTIEETAFTEELPRPSRPLSPYTQFPTLKPPGPPSPPPAPKIQQDVTEAASAVPEESVLAKEEEKSSEVVESSSSKETKAVSGGFRWPWQKPEPEPEEEIQQGETAPINQTTIQEEATTKKTEELPRPSGVLSPYTAYPALKPPFPPAPPTTTVKPGESEIEAKVEAPKEPSSPVAEVQEEINARAEEEARLKALAEQEAELVMERERLAVEKAQAAVGFRWPWGKAEIDSEEVQAEVTVASTVEVVPELENSAPTESSQSTSTSEPQKSRPLSPYIMYPGMKPPGPPSPPKGPSKEPAEATLAEPARSEESRNGFASETVQEEEKVLEPAGGFRWPWEQQ